MSSETSRREPDYWLLRRPNNEISVHRTNKEAKDKGDAYCFVEPLYCLAPANRAEMDTLREDLRVEIEGRNQMYGRLDEARGEAAVTKRELEESRAETAAALTDLDNVKAAMEALREQLRRERADVQPALAAVSRALAEKQAECDEASRKLALATRLLAISRKASGTEAQVESIHSTGPGWDIQADGQPVEVPVCPVCGKVKERRLGGQRQYSCDCLARASRGRWLYGPEWWQHVAVHIGCSACARFPVLTDGLLHHRCPATGKRWRKEPREWYARHGGAGEQAPDGTE